MKPIHPAFLPTQRFLKFLDTLEKTASHRKAMDEQRKKDKARREVEFAEQKRLDAEHLDKLLSLTTRAKRGGWSRGGKGQLADYVPRGRVHLIDDDDRQSERRKVQKMGELIGAEHGGTSGKNIGKTVERRGRTRRSKRAVEGKACCL